MELTASGSSVPMQLMLLLNKSEPRVEAGLMDFLFRSMDGAAEQSHRTANQLLTKDQTFIQEKIGFYTLFLHPARLLQKCTDC